MCLITRCSSGTDLLHTHHQLDNIEIVHDLCHLCRGDTGDQLKDLFSGYMNVHDHPGDLQRRYAHGFFCSFNIDCIICDKLVDKIKIFTFLSVQFNDLSILYFYGWGGIIRAFHCHKSHLRPFIDIPIQIDRTLVQCFNSF